ncbi:MAG: hypothetical protein ACFBSG_01870 [Leptolyngbyaceae cyanobacterium]
MLSFPTPLTSRLSLKLGLVLGLWMIVSGGLSGCVAPAVSESETVEKPDSEVAMPPEMVPQSVSDRVLEQASQDLSVPKAALTFRRFNPEVWLDSCLGLGRLNESCLRTLVPGWQLEVLYQDQAHFYRADEQGEVIRRSTLAHNLPPSIAERVIIMAAAETQSSADQWAIAMAEPRLWDGCLGVAPPDAVCAQVAIFGWRVTATGAGKTLIYHTDMSGDAIRLNGGG